MMPRTTRPERTPTGLGQSFWTRGEQKKGGFECWRVEGKGERGGTNEMGWKGWDGVGRKVETWSVLRDGHVVLLCGRGWML